MKKISLNRIRKILSCDEMKNVTGGSGSCCYVEDSNGNGYCYRQPPSGGGEHWECNTPFAYDFCKNVC